MLKLITNGTRVPKPTCLSLDCLSSVAGKIVDVCFAGVLWYFARL